MRIAGLIQDSIVDGPGIRFVVFAQGCKSCCEGCHNPETWNPNGGREMPVNEIIEEMLSNPLTDGLTLSGGEPFEQAADCASLAVVAREKGLNVWVFTGWTFEKLLNKAKIEPKIRKLLNQTDVLIDGRYIKAEHTLSSKWCGSKNQRVLDIRKSLVAGKGVLWDEC